MMFIRTEFVETRYDWSISIDQKFGQAERSFEKESAYPCIYKESAYPCIYRIPKCLRTNDDKAYTPQIVSLGPYHHGKEGLADMDRHKWRALVKMVRRYGKPKEVYFDAVREMEENARPFYESPIELDSNQFVEMMVLDACFVLEILRSADTKSTPKDVLQHDLIIEMGGLMHFIQRDMLMLENQIPLIILEELSILQTGKEGEVERLAQIFFHPLIPTHNYKIQTEKEGKVERLVPKFFHSLIPTHKTQAEEEGEVKRPARKFFHSLIPTHKIQTEKEGKVERLVRKFFHPLIPTHKKEPDLTDTGGSIKRHNHFLDVFRRLLEIPDGGSTLPELLREGRTRPEPIHCVTHLKDAGIKIKSKKTDKFWDITFKNGILEIPQLLIDDATECVFLNLIAYEQRHAWCFNTVTLYAIFMDSLIDSQDDVSYLRRRGVIQNWMGSDKESADLFNRLCKDVVSNKKDKKLGPVFKEVNAYCENKCRAWTASFKYTYFRNPWTAFSLFAAFVLLLLTSAQTFYTIYAYYTPPP